MEFTDPIVGGETLVRSAIQSANFQAATESSGVEGWRIEQDGTAIFNDVVIGSVNYNIDEDGNAVLNDITANGDIFLNGASLTDTLYRSPIGVLSGVQLTGQTANYNGTKVAFATIAAPNPDPNRLYRLKMSNIKFNRSSASTSSKVVNIFVCAGLTNPVPSTTTTFTSYHIIDDGTGSGDDTFSTDWPLTFGTTDTVYFTFYFSMNGNANNTKVIASSTDQSTIYIEDLGLPDSFQLYDVSGGSGAVEGTFTKTYTATSSASYQSDGSNRGIAEMYQGYYSGTNGNQFSMALFNHATIAADLTGSTVDKVELYLNNNHFYANSGGTAVIGTHNQTSLSGTHSSSQLTDDIIRYHYDKGQAKWVTIDNAGSTGIGNAFRDGTAKGICLGQGPTTSTLYYGYFAGATQSGPPQLRITYTK